MPEAERSLGHAELAEPLLAAGGLVLLDVLGRGPRGTVYRGEKEGRFLAVKVFDPGVPVDARTLETLARAAGDGLRHPNLALAEERGEVEGRFFYATRLFRGDSLRQTLDDVRRGEPRLPSLSPLAVGPEGALDPEYILHAAHLLAEVAEGLDLAHRAGAVHRRIAPENLFFSPGGRLVLTDFGGWPGENEPDHWPYRAPEALAQKGEGGPRGDVYALGAVLYEIATFQPPAPASGAGRRRARSARGRKAIPRPRQVRAEVPQALEDCILKALAADPEERYATAGDLAVDLRRFAAGRSPEASVRRLSPPPRRRRTLAGRVARAAALAAVVAAAALGARRFQTQLETERRRASILEWVREGRYDQARAETERLLAANPGDLTARTLLENASRQAASRHLVRALSALESQDPAGAACELEAAHGLVPADGEIQRLHAEVRTRARRDPLAGSLADPRAAVRLGALRELARALASGERPPRDRALAAPLLEEREPSVAAAAFEVYAAAGASAPLLEALGIHAGTPAAAREGREGRDSARQRSGVSYPVAEGTFLLLFRTLAAIDDGEARGLLCLWSAERMEALDRTPRPALAALPGEVVVHLDTPTEPARGDDTPAAARPFSAAWIRAAGRVRPDDLLRRAPALARDHSLAPVLLEVLEELEDPRGRAAIVAIARECPLACGREALAALRRMGAAGEILALLESDLGLELRRAALASLEPWSDQVARELETLVVTSPYRELRQEAFRLLEAAPPGAASQAGRAVLAALRDPALRHLRDEVLAMAARLAPAERARVALELLAHRDRQVRDQAVELLASLRDPALLPDLVLRLFDSRSAVRRGAVEALASGGGAEELSRQAVRRYVAWFERARAAAVETVRELERLVAPRVGRGFRALARWWRDAEGSPPAPERPREGS